MVERALIRYQRLCEVRLLHHYWLDEGATVFDRIADANKRNARLLAYDMRPFLSVRPTASTASALAGQGCQFRPTPLGFVIAAPERTRFAADAVLAFIVSAVDSRFFDYTALTLRPQRIHEAFDPSDTTVDRVTVRYKENVAVLSNLTGIRRGTGAAATLFLSRASPAPSADDQAEALVVSAGALLQLTSDNPGAATQELAAVATDLPAYVTQADAPVIVPPAGVSGAPARGVKLSPDIPDDVFALISLTAVRADDDAFSFVDAAGAAKAAFPVYQIRLRNRSTSWVYFDKQSGAQKSVEANPLPLTCFGNAGTQQKPSQGPVKAERSGTRITRLVSEIYV
jgi:hypothetical protein